MSSKRGNQPSFLQKSGYYKFELQRDSLVENVQVVKWPQIFHYKTIISGIYRLSGVNTKINKLLSDFRENAWNVHIARDCFSEHDVANTLKRFMRTLDEPILLEQLRSDWMEASMMEDQSDKLIRSDIIFCLRQCQS